jgi:hypothetical protein
MFSPRGSGRGKERTYTMARAVKHPSASREATENIPFDKVLAEDPERIVLECDCRAKLVLGSWTVAWLLWDDRFECGVCGKGFIISGMVSHRYSWVEDYLERVDGREARHEYYRRLEYPT